MYPWDIEKHKEHRLSLEMLSKVYFIIHAKLNLLCSLCFWWKYDPFLSVLRITVHKIYMAVELMSLLPVCAN